jgi:large repetitive protein
MSCLPSVFASLRHLCLQDGTDQEPGADVLRGRSLRLGLAAAMMTALAVGAVAQAPLLTFPATSVGTPSAEVTVAVSFQTAGEVVVVKVLTLGAPGLDFAAGTGASCINAEKTAGQTCPQSLAFTPSAPGLRMGAVVLVGDNGKILGTTYISGIGQGGLGVMVPGNTLSVAGSYRAWTSTKDGILATAANLWEPQSMAFDGAGNMYVADTLHNKIRVVAPPASGATAGIITTFAGTGDAGFSGDGGQAKLAALNGPSGVAIDGAGNVYVADTGNNRIRKITPAGIITTLAGNGVPDFAGDTQPADGVNTELNNPYGLTIDYAGNLYIADTNNQRVRRIDAATGVITTVAGNGIPSGNGDGYGTYTGDGGPASAAGLSLPYAVAFDGSGNMFIPDSANNCIRRVDASTGIITTVAGTGGKSGYKGDGGAATAALLDVPSGVAVDAAGNLYIADTQNSAIRKVNSLTGKISSLIVNGLGSALPLPGTGSLGPVAVYAPIGLFLDGKGNLYFADRYNMLVREVVGNAGVLNFTATSVFLGQQSTTPLVQTVENDGNAPFTLTALTADPNAAIDPNTTTCNLTDALTLNATCNIGVFFAPSTSVVIPAGQSKFQVLGNVDAESATPNSPLDVIAVGNAAPTNATTVTVTSSPANPYYGQNITLKATVDSGSATPTGTVAFTIDGTATVPASINVSAAGNNTAIATYSTTAPLSVGIHAIDATFAAAKNTNFLPSDGTLNVEVDAGTSTALTSSVNGNTTTLGTSVTFTAKVIASGGVTPDGTVTFNDGSTVLGGPVAIDASGLATFTTGSLAVGPHSITASFSGDPANYILPSRSGVLSLDVQGASNITLGSSPNPSVYGDAVTFTVTVTSTSGTAATGTVTFLDGTTSIGAAALAGNPATASFTTAALTAGSHAINATYPGDQNNGSSYASIAQVVNLVGTTTSVTATPNPGIAGQAVTLVATVKANSGTRVPTGTITFTDAATSLGSAKVAANGTASIAVSGLTPGPHAIAAAYSGDANDAPSPSNNLALEVNLATTAVAVTSSGSPATVLNPITFTASVTGNGGTPEGSVVFSVDGVAGSSLPLVAGKASYTNSTLGVGSHVVAASYSGDTNDSASSSSGFTQVIQAIATSTSIATASTGGTTPQTLLVATVAAAGTGPVPTGTVLFKDDSKTIGTATLDGNGAATLLPDLAPATYNIHAEYSGDAIHSTSTSGAVKVTGTPVGFGMTVDPSTVTLSSSQNTTVTVTFSSNNGYADTLGLGCGTLPMGVSCNFANLSIPLKAGGTATVKLTLDTNAPLGGGATAMNSASRTGGFSLAGLFLPAGLLFGWVGWRFRKRNAVFFTALLALGLGAAAMVTGCGGFSQKSARPGTYTIQVNAVGTSSNIAHYQTVTLTITH